MDDFWERAWWHFVGAEREVPAVPPGFLLVTLSDAEVFELYCAEVEKRDGAEAVEFARANCLHEYSFGLLHGGELVGYCALEQAPNPENSEPSTGGMFEELLREYRKPFAVSSIVSANEWQKELVVAWTLQVLRKGKFYEIVVLPEHSDSLRDNGSAPFTSRKTMGYLELALTRANMGMDPGFSGDVPENFLFRKMQWSPNHLYCLELTQFELNYSSKGRIISPGDAALLAPYLFEAFGNNGDLIGQFVESSAAGTSTASYESDENTAACLVSEYNLVAEISAIYTRPAWKKQGLARGLLTHSLTLLKEKGFKFALAHVAEKNLASTNLFLSFGFERVETVAKLFEIGRLSGFVKNADLRRLLAAEGIKVR